MSRSHRFAELWSRHRAMRALLLGIMWGITASTIENVSLPVVDATWTGFYRLFAWNMLAWTIVGVGIAWLVDYGNGRIERRSTLALCIVAGALAFAGLATLLFSHRVLPGPALSIDQVFPNGRDPLASFLFQVWVVLFYGGLYVIAARLSQRAVRMRTHLGQVEIARIRSETLLGEASLQALRGHIDPQILLQVMREIERRYKTAPEAADRLVGLLVAFLRQAMPGVRSSTSTLAAELALVRTYSTMRAEFDRESHVWQLQVPSRISDVAFPPLLLLPILDALGGPGQHALRGRLVVTQRREIIMLAFYIESAAPSAGLASDLEYRTRVGLSTLFDNRWTMAQRTGGTPDVPALVLSIPSAVGVAGYTPGTSRDEASPRKELLHDE